jgi:hypothetical protein
MANNIYANPGTPITFQSSGGSAVLTPTSVAAGAGRISAQFDRGAGAQPALYRWRAFTKWLASPAVGDQLRLYLVTSDGTNQDGNGLGTADAAVASEAELSANCQQFGSVIAGAAASQTEAQSGFVEIRERYISVAIWDGSATKALTATATDTAISLTPWPDQIQ